jgi:hypothetical protein
VKPWVQTPVLSKTNRKLQRVITANVIEILSFTNADVQKGHLIC